MKINLTKIKTLFLSDVKEDYGIATELLYMHYPELFEINDTWDLPCRVISIDKLNKILPNGFIKEYYKKDSDNQEVTGFVLMSDW